ncbi:hypothetical protein BDFB_012735, partial [Asbolus verrucosus]
NCLMSNTIVLNNKRSDLNVSHILGVIQIDVTQLTVHELNETVAFLKKCYCFDSRANYLVIAKSPEDVDFISNIFCTAFCFVTYNSQNENHFKDITGNVLYIFAISINFPGGRFPNKRTLKLLVMSYCWTSLLTSVVLEARLYDIFSNPVYENDVTDLEKLLSSDLPLKFPEGMAILFLFTGPQNQRVFDTYIATNLSLMGCLNELITRKDFATIIDTGILVMRPNIKEIVNIFDIAYFQTVFYMKKHHELFEIFNAVIKRIVESGFSVDMFLYY